MSLSIPLILWNLIYRRMHLIPLHTICSGGLQRTPPDQVLTSYGFQRHRLFHEPVEQQPTRARCAAVKSKGVFVQIIVQVIRTDRSLMSAQQPPLQQRGNPIRPRQQVLAQVGGGRTTRCSYPKSFKPA
jgi:hypothetical protein